MCTIPSKEMPKSTYAGSYNSVLSYASGIVGNKLRNPSEDYTKKQLRYIKKLFDIILKFQQNNVSEETLTTNSKFSVKSQPSAVEPKFV